MKKAQQMKWWRVLIIVFVVTVFFFILIDATLPKYTAASTPEEIAGIDLSKEYICLSLENAEIYPGRLYESSDFSEGIPEAGDASAKFQTCRIVLPLKAGVVYGIRGQTATYAQRVYVNGALLSAVGTVSTNPNEFVPKTDLYTVYFTPQSDTTEIIVQHAWFNHARGALYYRVVVFKAPLQGHVLHCKGCCGLVRGSYRKTVHERLQPQPFTVLLIS